MAESFLLKAPPTALAAAVFFGSFIFARVALATRAALKLKKGDGRGLSHRHGPLDVANWYSCCDLCHSLSSLGLILFYAYLCEHHPPYPHSDKSYDRDYVFFLTALILVLAGTTWKRNSDIQSSGAPHKVHERNAVQEQCKGNDNAILNRHQTEEWKGWMQAIFLLYHYFHGVELYNPIRVMITCYVWMTGFGNFSFFYTTGDYSIVRVLQMLWRLNFLVVCLCLTQGTPYILYYICALHTFCFGMVYATMRVASHWNYSMPGIRKKLVIVAILVWVVWDFESGLFGAFFGLFLSENPTVGAVSGTLWEFYFRTTLDHWSTLWGMVFALLYPVTSLFWIKSESLTWWRHFAIKGVMGVVLLGCFAWWLAGPFREERHVYNQTHAYFGIIPLMTYIFWRNLTPWLRSHSFEFLRQLGKSTLETYLMQHHIWMTSNAKTLLTFVPGYPKVNFLVVTLLYVFLSRSLFRLTMVLRCMLLPNDLRICMVNLGMLASTYLLCYLIILFLIGTNTLDMLALGICSMFGGSVIYSTIMSFAGQSFSELATSATFRDARMVSKYLPFHYLGAGVILCLLGSSWNYMALYGASKLQPLPETCVEYVRTGAWLPVDLCTDDVQGKLSRSHGVSGLATCAPSSPTHVWGWNGPPPATHCRMRQRSSVSVLESLQNRNITFVGDSVLRHLYHSMCRQVGDAKAGAYNTATEKHGNFTRRYQTLGLDFRWAPYTYPTADGTLGDTLRSIFENEERLPDAIVVGGGAWDQLHYNHNETAKENLVEGIRQVATEIRRLREASVSVTWVIPTTINTWGLMTEQKRENLREEQMVSLRALYKDHGIHDASNFVIDGASFTKDRVSDSYDGVHYPLEVYDAGSQIILNAFDWLLPADENLSKQSNSPKLETMAHPFYGIVVVALLLLSLLSLDAFCGLSTFACTVAFTTGIVPSAICNEAYNELHQRKNLPPWNHHNHLVEKKGNGREGSNSLEDGAEMVHLVE